MFKQSKEYKKLINKITFLELENARLNKLNNFLIKKQEADTSCDSDCCTTIFNFTDPKLESTICTFD